MKVSDLEGALLNYWVARASSAWEWAHELFPTMTLDPTFKDVKLFTSESGSTECLLVPSNPFRQDYQTFSPSTEWAHGGPIIERKRICIVLTNYPGSWLARANAVDFDIGGTPLIAAMRAMVHSVYGEAVPNGEQP